MIKKPLLVSLAAAALLTGNAQAASMFDRMSEMETEMKALQAELAEVKAAKAVEAEADEAEEAEEAEEADDEEGEDEDEEESDADEIEEQLTELNMRTSGNHLKFGVDFRTAVDNLQYTMADGSKQDNGALMTNRLWLNMDWAATENISFTGQLAYNKTFGARSGIQYDPYSGNPGTAYETFDWITNENAYDDIVRVRAAYFFYRNDTFLGLDVPWTFSIGRRPSLVGHLINLRDDDPSASPMGHTINVEFDGLSSKFTLWEDIGMYVKLCAGRGMTNATPRFSAAPYASNEEVQDIDLGGLIFVPYDDGQYSIGTQYYYAANLIDAVNPGDPSQGMETVGSLHSFTANAIINGIGDGWSDFLDDTTIFASAAISITDPDKNKVMINSSDASRGYSAWAGIQFPSLISDEGRWGVEYNKGTANWRAITYGEDTNIGSKIAARGDAYEAYFTEPLIDDIFSFQLRYTYIDYKYTGSNGFFGGTTGKSQLISSLTPADYNMLVVDKAQDIRAYLRYRF